MIEIKRYTPKDAAEWNNFVWKSRQGTFLFDRNYMDYQPMNYIAKAYGSSKLTSELKTLLDAMYLYGEAAMKI